MAKKLINPTSFVDHFANANIALAYCIDRVNCIDCPMFLKGVGKRTHNTCVLPSYLETGSDAGTAVNIMRADACRNELKARYRQRILFDETK